MTNMTSSRESGPVKQTPLILYFKGVSDCTVQKLLFGVNEGTVNKIFSLNLLLVEKS